MDKIRHLIIHYHLFKNAGSTIDSILRKNFPLRCGAIEGKPMTYSLSNEELVRYIIENPNLIAVSSHEARPPVPIASNLKFYPILFLRHPIDRIGSIYSYRRSLNKWETRSTKVAHETDLAGYIRWCLANPSGETIINFQTSFLSKSLDGSFASPNLEVAINRIHELPFIGLVEQFDQSLLHLKNYLRESFGEINISYNVVNKSLDRMSTIQNRLEDIEISLGPNLYQEIFDINAMDIKLYEIAVKIFSEKKKEIDN